MASDLSQIITNQDNAVSLFVQNVQAGDVYVPNALSNEDEVGLTGATSNPFPVVFSALKLQPNNFALYAYGGCWANVQLTNSQTLNTGNNTIFNNGPVPTGVNFGVFTNGIFTVALTGTYHCTYTVSYVPTGITTTAISSIIATPTANLGYASINGTADSPEVMGGSAIFRLNKGDNLFFNFNSSSVRGTGATEILYNATMCFFMIGP